MKFGALILVLGIILFLTPSAYSNNCKNYFAAPQVQASANRVELKDNPLIEKSPHQNGLYPAFDKITPDHFLPALTDAIIKAEMILSQIRNEQNPTFESIILKLEESDRLFTQVMGPFAVYSGSFKTEKITEIESEITRILTEFNTRLSTDLKIFEQIKAVYEKSGNLKADEKYLVEAYYQGGLRSGAGLSPTAKARYTEIVARLSDLSDLFDNNISADKRNTFVHVKDIKELEGVSKDLIPYLEAAAKQRNLEGFVIEIGQPSILIAIRESAANENLRKELFFKVGQIAFGKEQNNNEPVAKEIATLRQELAELFGFKNYAEYALEARMAKNLDTLEKFLDSLVAAYVPKAEAEAQMLMDFKFQKTGSRDMNVWDRAYWRKQFETEKLSFDTEIFKDYLVYDNVREGFFKLVNDMYGITFKSRPDLPRPDAGMEVFEVRSENNELYGIISIDMYARPIKQGGAWMNGLSNSFEINGQRVPAYVSINMNLTKPVDNKPLRLSLNEGETYFHEFGHALHGLLSRARHASHSGTNVKRDFVELPSQVMENFFSDPKILSSFAFHYETNERIPQEYLNRLVEIKQMFSGTDTLRQLSLARIDLAWHSGQALKLTGTISEIDNAIMNPYLVLKNTENTSTSTNFSHIFSGGYSAGYYSYKWAEVLDADAYSILRTGGRDAAQKFLKHVLEVGGSMDPNAAYENFAGRPAKIDALLERDGVTKPNE